MPRLGEVGDGTPLLVAWHAAVVFSCTPATLATETLLSQWRDDERRLSMPTLMTELATEPREGNEPAIEPRAEPRP